MARSRRRLHRLEERRDQPAATVLGDGDDDSLPRSTVRIVKIRHGSIELNVTEDGSPSSPPLLLMHGITSSAGTWNALVPELAERFRVLRLDFRGHGDSDRAPDDYSSSGYVSDAVAVLEQVAGQPAIVMGHSLGGATTAAVAQRHPELVPGRRHGGPAARTRCRRGPGAGGQLTARRVRADAGVDPGAAGVRCVRRCAGGDPRRLAVGVGRNVRRHPPSRRDRADGRITSALRCVGARPRAHRKHRGVRRPDRAVRGAIARRVRRPGEARRCRVTRSRTSVRRHLARHRGVRRRGRRSSHPRRTGIP
ncbi:alpha/beta fold hydrolase [Ilumatobacter nonamiensis]|uniref:alpha/beta fold hydrolase n=1 Tax=Ilumatobacter nonamiensis TaxID=467093 RepID=UPI0009FC3072